MFFLRVILPHGSGPLPPLEPSAIPAAGEGRRQGVHFNDGRTEDRREGVAGGAQRPMALIRASAEAGRELSPLLPTEAPPGQSPITAPRGVAAAPDTARCEIWAHRAKGTHGPRNPPSPPLRKGGQGGFGLGGILRGQPLARGPGAVGQAGPLRLLNGTSAWEAWLRVPSRSGRTAGAGSLYAGRPPGWHRWTWPEPGPRPRRQGRRWLSGGLARWRRRERAAAACQSCHRSRRPSSRPPPRSRATRILSRPSAPNSCP